MNPVKNILGYKKLQYSRTNEKCPECGKKLTLLNTDNPHLGDVLYCKHCGESY